MYRTRTTTILLATAVLFAAVGYMALRPTSADGVVDFKAITGTRDSTSHTIATITDTGINVKDPEFTEDLKTSTTVDDALAHRLDSMYDEIKYIVSVRTAEGTMAYFVTREDYNRVGVGAHIRFEILRFKTTTIRIKGLSKIRI
jgi:hypothetical protein